MNKRKYLMSLGLLGTSGYTMHESLYKPALAMNINLSDSITLPSDVENLQLFTVQLNINKFEVIPQRIGSDVVLEDITVRGKSNFLT